MFNLLLDRFPLIGNEEIINFSLIHGPSADQHTLLTVWGRYGIFGSAIFLGILFIIVLKLLRIIRLKKLYHPEAVLAAVFLLANYIQFHGSMISGDLLRGDTIFVMIFFISEIEYYSSRWHPRFWKSFQQHQEPGFQPS